MYEQYGDLAHRRCLQLVRRPEDAEDALQETFPRVRRHGPPREASHTRPPPSLVLAQAPRFDSFDTVSGTPSLGALLLWIAIRSRRQ
ncbi:sigma factor [Archangium lipolyticum]|uniref:sigma factor n=1 Tax=Archangium lipolyticum TaxID=2970465 RepID=UPI0038994C81